MADPQASFNKASFSEYAQQSGRFINFTIQQLYEQTGRHLSLAVQYSSRGLAGKKLENQERRLGLDTFSELLTLSIHLPDVKMHLYKIKEEQKGFKDHHDLRLKITNALLDKVPSIVLLDRWFDAYSQALIYAGLIKVLTIKDDPTHKLWR